MRGKNKSPKVSRSAASRQSPDGVGSGKSNLWSLEAREDIYSRRHNGEEWETICKDYPSRTRHAMQQQYSVMRKQNAADNPSHTPSRRGGRRRRGVARASNWATVNQPRPGSSEEESDSVLQSALEQDDDDDDEYDGMPPPAESDGPDEDEPMVGEAVPGPKPPHSAAVGNAQESSRRPSATKGPGRPSMFVTFRRPSTSKNTLFPNLHSRSVDQVDPPSLSTDHEPVNPATKPAHGGPSKRRADAEGTDSESRSSSHLSKRRKYSTEPSETFNIIPADSAASLKLLDGFKLPGLFLHPDVIAKAMDDWKTMSTAYESEKGSRKETYEAALKRATRRANDTEHKLQDASQQYANNLKAEKEAHAKALEAKETLLEAKDKALEAKDKLLEDKDKALEAKDKELEAKDMAYEAMDKAFQATRSELLAEKEKPKGTVALTTLTSQLSEKESQLKLYDALRAQIDTQVSALKALQTTALDKSEDVKTTQATYTALVDGFGAEDFAAMNMVKWLSTIEKYSKEICEGNRCIVQKQEAARGTLRRTSEAIDAFYAQFVGESKGIGEGES